jgi:hypothetical protein
MAGSLHNPIQDSEAILGKIVALLPKPGYGQAGMPSKQPTPAYQVLTLDSIVNYPITGEALPVNTAGTKATLLKGSMWVAIDRSTNPAIPLRAGQTLSAPFDRLYVWYLQDSMEAPVANTLWESPILLVSNGAVSVDAEMPRIVTTREAPGVYLHGNTISVTDAYQDLAIDALSGGAASGKYWSSITMSNTGSKTVSIGTMNSGKTAFEFGSLPIAAGATYTVYGVMPRLCGCVCLTAGETSTLVVAGWRLELGQ